MNILKRTIQRDIIAWLDKADRKMTLMINGVRRCGKTRNITHILNIKRPNNWIGFDLTNSEDLEFLIEATKGTVEDFMTVLDSNSRIDTDNETIIFIDEVQENEQIHFFIKRYNDYTHRKELPNNLIVSGSYINSAIFKKRYKSITGTAKELTMYPLSFFEFVSNVKAGEKLISSVQESIRNKKEIPSPIHKLMLSLLDDYMFVGGYPINVLTYLNKGLEQGMNEINSYSKTLTLGQKEDIKYGVNLRDSLKLEESYEAVKYGFPNNGKSIKKFMFSYIKNDPSIYKGTAETNINILRKSQVILPIKQISDGIATGRYKLLYSDMSILNNMVDFNMEPGNRIGWVGEHFVGLELLKYTKRELRYWYKKKPNTNKPGYEIDYLIFNNHPLEVKYRKQIPKMRSLDIYNYEKRAIVISLKNYGCDSPKYVNLPMYAVWMINEVVESI